ncbi:MAG: hypothetical protein ACQEQU_04600 [Spirochaetota bacterium]
MKRGETTQRSPLAGCGLQVMMECFLLVEIYVKRRLVCRRFFSRCADNGVKGGLHGERV